MFSEINIEEVKKQKKIQYSKPEVFEGKNFPLEKLNDIEFEILVYYLYENNQDKKKKYGYDRAIYIEGGSDQGKDIVLKKNDQIVGIVQCKHSKIKKNHGIETISHELIKILLYMIIDPEKTNSEKINYLLVISSSFTKGGEEYIKNMKTYFGLNNEELEKKVNKVIKGYSKLEKHFEGQEIENIIENVIENFKRIVFLYEEEQDILLELNKEQKGIKESFFSLRTVVESEYFPEFEGEENEDILRKKKDEYFSELFCKRLQEIECNEKNIEKAILHFYKKQSVVADLSMKGIIKLEEHLKKFENNILEIESSERDCFIVDYDSEEIKNIKTSYKYYIKFLNMIIKHPVKVRRLGEATIDFKCGTIHDLVNEQKIEKWYLGDGK